MTLKGFFTRMFGKAGGSDDPPAKWYAQSDLDWKATHKHRKGGLYRVLAVGVLEADRSNAVIYDDATGQIWVRPEAEFYDGRFLPLSDTERDVLNTKD